MSSSSPPSLKALMIAEVFHQLDEHDLDWLTQSSSIMKLLLKNKSFIWLQIAPPTSSELTCCECYTMEFTFNESTNEALATRLSKSQFWDHLEDNQTCKPDMNCTVHQVKAFGELLEGRYPSEPQRKKWWDRALTHGDVNIPFGWTIQCLRMGLEFMSTSS